MKRLGLIALLLLGSLTASSSATAGAQRVLRLARSSDPQTLDAARAYMTYDIVLLPLVYLPLLDVVDGTRLIPCAARDWKVSPDSRTYTFHLRPQVKFSSGRAVTASDYAYALERSLDPRTASILGVTYLGGIRGAASFIESRALERTKATSRPGRWLEPTRVAGLLTPSPDTLVIELEKPDPTFGYVMANTFGMAVAPEEIERTGARPDVYPVGTGPYMVQEWVRGVRMTLIANPYYAGPVPRHFDRIEIMLGGDPSTHVMMFERGELDIAAIEHALPIPDYHRLRRDPRWKQCFEVERVLTTMFIALNTQMPPLDNVKVRQALNYAVDKVRCLNCVDGRFEPAAGVMPPCMPAFNPRLGGYGYDPARAAALLKESGAPLPLRVTLWHGLSPDHRQIGQSVQSDLRRIGVEVELKPVAESEFNTASTRPRVVQMGYTGWTTPFPDPKDILGSLFDGRNLTHDTSNSSFYNCEEVNRLLDLAATNMVASARYDLYRQAEEIIVRDAPVIFLGFPKGIELKQPWLKGKAIEPVWPSRYDRLWIER